MTNLLAKLPPHLRDEIWDSIRRGVENGAIRTHRQSFQATFALIAAGWIIYRNRDQESNSCEAKTSEPCGPSKSTQQDSEDRHSHSSQASHTDSSGAHQASDQERNRSSIEDLQRDWRRRTKAYLLLLDLLDKSPTLASMKTPEILSCIRSLQ